MEDLFIPQKRYTPEIKFLTSGHLSIKGVSLLENSFENYSTAISWLLAFGEKQPTDINFDLKFIYVDTSSMRSLVDMIKMLNGFSGKGFNITINWFYEQGDEDQFDTGEALRSIAKVKFNLVAIDIDDYE